MTSPKSVLVYTDGELMGEGVIKLPFAMALKQALPYASLTWMCGGGSVYTEDLQELASSVIDEVLIQPRGALDWREALSAHPLEGRHFDIIIDTQADFKRTLWLRRISHGKFITASLSGKLRGFRAPERSGGGGAIFESLMKLASRAAGQKIPSIATMEVHPRWDSAAARLLPGDKKYIGFVPGAGRDFKCWPLERFLTLAQQQVALGLTPAIFLGPQEASIMPIIHEALPEAVFPLCNVERKDPSLTIALGRRLVAAVSNDSGGGHLIAAGGTPMVSIFRSAKARSQYMPASPRVIALSPEDFGGRKLEDIPLEAVSAALEKLRKTQ